MCVLALFRFALGVLLTGMVSSQSWAEPVMIAMVGSRPDMAEIEHAERALSYEEQRNAITLIRVGPRVGVSGKSPFGKDQIEDFQQYDLAAVLGLPLGWRDPLISMKLDTRLHTSAGQLASLGDAALMVTIVPCLTLSSPNEAVSIDVGAGVGLFSRYKFGAQDFGGPAQIVGTIGLGMNLISDFYTGYRFQHFSDAGMYGPTSLGVDIHLFEVNYRF
jgi:hypothetical protein